MTDSTKAVAEYAVDNAKLKLNEAISTLEVWCEVLGLDPEKVVQEIVNERKASTISRTEDAKKYIEYGVRKGFIQEEYDLSQMSDKEIRELADRLDAAGEYAYEAWKEQDV